jgi:hypothetical protein
MPRALWEAMAGLAVGLYLIEGKYDLAKEQLSTIERLCGKDCEYYYQDLTVALTEAHAL